MNYIFTRIGYFFRVFRFIRLGNFIHVALGMLVVRQQLVYENVALFGLVFLVFGVFLYGGIYAINNLVDFDDDKAHPIKKIRVVAGNFLNKDNIQIAALSMIGISFLLGFYYLPQLLGIQCLLLMINLFYTFMLKKIDLLNAAVVVNVTHALRFMTGVIIAGGSVWDWWLYYLIPWSGLFILVTYKIQREHSGYARVRLHNYRNVSLAVFGFMLFVSFLLKPNGIVLGYYVLHYGLGIGMAQQNTGRLADILHYWWNT